MKKKLGLTGLILVVVGLIATVCFVWVELPIHRWVEMDAVACGTLAVCLAGCVLGWRSSGIGRWAAVLGTPLVVIWLAKLVLFIACQLYIIDEEHDEEFPWSTDINCQSGNPDVDRGTIEPTKAEAMSGVCDRWRVSICFFFFPRTTTDAKPQAEQQELPLHLCLNRFALSSPLRPTLHALRSTCLEVDGQHGDVGGGDSADAQGLA